MADWLTQETERRKREGVEKKKREEQSKLRKQEEDAKEKREYSEIVRKYGKAIDNFYQYLDAYSKRARDMGYDVKVSRYDYHSVSIKRSDNLAEIYIRATLNRIFSIHYMDEQAKVYPSAHWGVFRDLKVSKINNDVIHKWVEWVANGGRWVEIIGKERKVSTIRMIGIEDIIGWFWLPTIIAIALYLYYKFN